MFNVNDFVFIRPTGDPRIDRFLGMQMIVVNIIPVRDGDARYTSYLLANFILLANGDLIRFIGDLICVNSASLSRESD